MQLTDHYRVLELHPSASLPEIKKAYRRLALIYHPDKNNGDPYTREHFNAIKEAYEVLTNPSRKERWLQQRWYYQSTGKRTSRDLTTPVSVLKQSLELDRYVSRLDTHRMDKEGLRVYILELLSDDIIGMLNSAADLAVNREITSSILRCTSALPIESAEPVYRQLDKLMTDIATKETLEQHKRRRHRIHQWDKYRTGMILVIVLLLCLLIYLFS